MDKLKEKVLLKSKEAYAEKLFAGTSGNLSAIDREKGLVAITPTSIPYPVLKKDHIVIIDLDGNLIEGNYRPSSEWRMHTEIYKNKPEVNAIVHTHSPNATAFAVAHEEIPVVLIEMMFFLFGNVPLAKYAAPGSEELGVNCVKAMEKRTSCLLENHGVVAIGNDLDEAYTRAVYVEDAANIYIKSRIIGNPKIISREEQNKMRRKMGVAEA